MKNVTFLSMIMLTVHLWSFAQCDPKGITTNPDAPVNPEQPSKTNTFFDWRKLDYNMHQTINGISIPTTIPAPFDQIDNSNVLSIHGMEFRPEDGWELIARNLGYKDDGTPRTDMTNPYLVLYNRFTGRLRFFLAIGDKDEDYQTAEVIIMQNSGRNGDFRAVFGHADNLMEPVQTFNPANNMATIQRFINEDNKWLTAEYQMAYDPCTCMDDNKPILIEANLIDSARITISGTVNGTITPIEIKNKKVTSKGITLKGTSTFFKKVGDAVETGTTIYNGAKDLFAVAKEVATKTDSSTTPPTQSVDPTLEESIEDLIKINDWDKWGNFGPSASPTSSGSGSNTGSSPSGGSSSGGSSSGGKAVKFLTKTLKAVPYIGKALGVLTSFIDGGSAPKGPQQVTFGPLAMEAKIKMSGHISTSNTFKTINFNMPGSTNLPANDLYPYYNETLGIMNVLERPKVEKLSYQVEVPSFDWNQNDDPTWNDEIEGIYTQFELTEDILYSVNPAPGFDMDQLDILGAMFFETKNSKGTRGMIEVGNNLYRTPFLPLGCLQGYIAEFKSNYVTTPPIFENVYFKIAAALIRTDNINAAPVIYAASYKVDITEVQSGSIQTNTPKPSTLPDLEGENIRIENRVLQPGEEVFATQSITIGPNVTVASGGTASLIAGASIIIEDDIELDPKLDLRIDDPTPCKRNVPPATRAQIQAICQSNTYQERANKRSESVVEEIKQEQKLLTDPVAFPNPSSGQFTVRYELAETAQELSAKVLDITGRTVLTPIEAGAREAGFHTFDLNMDAFPTGFYSLILTIDGIPHTVKLVKE
jgi:uncharacterized membrane protein YgcG